MFSFECRFIKFWTDMIPAAGFNFEIEDYSQKVDQFDSPIFTSICTINGTSSQLKLVVVGRSKMLMDVFCRIDEPGYVQTQLFCQTRSYDMIEIAEAQWWKLPYNNWKYLAVIAVEIANNSYVQRDGKLILCLYVNRLEQRAVFGVPDSLLHSYRRMLSVKPANVKIVSSDKRTFKAHKLVLMHHSAVFTDMLDSKRKSKKSVIRLDDVNGELLEELLVYFYTDRCANLLEKSDLLLYISDKYKLHGLKPLSEKAVFHQLNPENAIRSLILSDMCHSRDLKKRILVYIKEGPTKEILQSKDWPTISSCKLLRNIIEHLLKMI